MFILLDISFKQLYNALNTIRKGVDFMLLKDVIAKYRSEHNLSQRAFAAKCGVTNGYMSMIENGKNPSTGKPIVPSFSKLKQIANGMDISVHQLIQISDDMEIDISSENDTKPDSDKTFIEALAEHYGLTALECDIIQAFLDMEPDQQKVFLDMARSLRK